MGKGGSPNPTMTEATDADDGEETSDELPASTTRFGHYVADSIEDMADHSNAMRSLAAADDLVQTDNYGLAASNVRSAARRLNRIADTLRAEQNSR